MHVCNILLSIVSIQDEGSNMQRVYVLFEFMLIHSSKYYAMCKHHINCLCAELFGDV